MRISKEEAAANRVRILDAAGRLIRKRGFTGLAIGEVMEDAGLTHGGFYNHFKSKEDLAAAAVRVSFDAAIGRVVKRAEEAQTPKKRRDAFKHYVERYLSPEMRDHPDASCPMAALGTDAARHGEGLKAAFTEGLERYLAAFERIVPDADDDREARTEAITMLSTLIGALTISRACAGSNDALSDEILKTVLTRLKQ